MRGVPDIILLLSLARMVGERHAERIAWRTVVVGVALQWVLAALLLRFPPASGVLLL